MGRITTHVLDTARGKPGGGIRIEVFGADGTKLAEAKTNADGRTDGPLLEGERFKPGAYELVFHVGAYFGGDAFYERVPVRIKIADSSQHYHVPLLCSPWGYTTYRGS
ncbi:MAG: hydroxyisourate hydrolase [Betaproteobacteria bacterium]|nr:hydroxyisourate hydrolase [Betaproteobacteria bacterium]MBV9362580.1 hydroxyisourate hydrolase [Betaproteobacteria bacterium]